MVVSFLPFHDSFFGYQRRLRFVKSNLELVSLKESDDFNLLFVCEINLVILDGGDFDPDDDRHQSFKLKLLQIKLFTFLYVVLDCNRETDLFVFIRQLARQLVEQLW